MRHAARGLLPRGVFRLPVGQDIVNRGLPVFPQSRNYNVSLQPPARFDLDFSLVNTSSFPCSGPRHLAFHRGIRCRSV